MLRHRDGGETPKMASKWRRIKGSIARAPLRPLIFAFVLLGTTRAALRAQDTPRSTAADSAARADSLLARLERAEAAIKLMREQLNAQAGSAVQSRSRAGLEFSGRVFMNAFVNSGRSNNIDVPQVAVAPAVGAGYQDRSAGASFRQTTLALSAQGGKLWGADASAFVEGDFFGGVQSGAGGRKLFPEPRLRIARATLKWSDVELMVGQDVPLITPIEPASVASSGSPEFAVAGNLWFWLPQIRATMEFAGPVRIALQGALLAPWSGGDILAGDADAADIGERQRLPMVQTRVRARWGMDETEGEVGLGVHYGLLGTAADTSLVSFAVALSWRVPVASWLDVRGEAYAGQMLKGLGGGGAGQNFGTNALAQTVPMRDVGGWLQLNFKPDATWQIGGGAGRSEPNKDDRPVRQRNDAFEVHATWRPGGLPFIGVELREIQSTYAAGLFRTRQVNLAVGVEF